MSGLKVLYIGQLFKGSTALHRANAITRVGLNLTRINSTQRQDILTRGINKFHKKIFGHLVEDKAFNQKVKAIISSNSFDLLWVDKGIRINPETIQYFKLKNPESPAVHYSPDDMMNPSNQTAYYLKGVPLYDLHVTTKSYNVRELKTIGAKDVLMVDNAFAPEVHHPVSIDPKECSYYGAKVGFIGAYEPERAAMIQDLVTSGVQVKVWGKSWRKLKDSISGLEIMPVDMLEEAYTKVLNATDINLCFLRKVNRDLQTTRTMEIPACGVFMLAERTEEHQRLFKEGEEADFFSDSAELFQKVKYYLGNDHQRIRIAEAGHRRCMISGYSNDARVSQILQYLGLPVSRNLIQSTN